MNYDTIAGNLDNAIDNGYTEILDWSVEDIAIDLITCVADCEECTVEELVPHIRTWLEKRKQ